MLGVASVLLLGSCSYASEETLLNKEKAVESITSAGEQSKQKVEHFGLSFQIGNDWEAKKHQYNFKSHQSGYAGYEGYLPGAKKKVLVNIEMSPKKIEEIFKNSNTPDTYTKTKIGSGNINGHPVDIYYFETRNKNKKNGTLYVSFKDEMYFADPDDPNSDFFSMHAYISLAGELFADLMPQDIQTVLDTYAVPLLDSIRVTDLNTFATDTTKQSIPFELKYQKKSDTTVKTVLEKKTDPFAKFKLVPMGGKAFVWKNFVLHPSDAWYKNSVKSNEKTLTLQTDDVSNLEMVILSTKVSKFKKKYKDMVLKEVYKSIKSDRAYSQTVLQKQSKYTVLGNEKCSVIMAIGSDSMKIYTFLPYLDGKLYTLVAIATNAKEKRLSSKVQELLKGISLKEKREKRKEKKVKSVQKKSTEKPFSNLNFTVSIKYTPRALRKLEENGEKVTVSTMIDQYGEQYMEEEGVALKDITVNPGQNAVFHDIPLRVSTYRHKPNKKYVATINIFSARKVFVNNLLTCSGKIDFDIRNIKGRVLEFECKLIR